MARILGSYLTGIHPRTPETIRISQRYERKEATREQLDEALRSDSSKAIDDQYRLGFTYLDDGQYFDDMFRQLIATTEGLSVGPLARWFDNNTFFKRPKVDGKKLKYTGTADALSRTSLLPNATNWKINLPGPYTLAHVAELPAGYDRGEFMFAAANYIARLIDNLDEFALFNLNEPTLAYNTHHGLAGKSEMRDVVDAVNTIANWERARRQDKGKKIALHTYFGSFTNLCPGILECDVDVFGVDMTRTDEHSLPFGDMPSREYALGLVNSRSSLVESPQQLVESIIRISREIDGKGIYVVPNCDLEHVTSDIARQKMGAVGTTIKLLKGG